MAMHLIDRPSLAHDALDPRRRGFSTVASMALHALVLLSLIAALRLSPPDAVIDATRRIMPQRLVWIPQVDAGGGRAGGGDHAIAPARRVRQVGNDAASVPSVETRPSMDVQTPPPDEVTAIPAKPMADATQAFAGTIDGDPATRSAGPGNTGAGASAGSDRGVDGDRPGRGFGDGAMSGGLGVTFPVPLEQVKPQYTADAMRARVQGSVWIECVVLPDGTVGDARVMRSLDRRFGLDEQAIAAAKRWRFRPGTLRGQPVPVIVTIELMFSVR